MQSTIGKALGLLAVLSLSAIVSLAETTASAPIAADVRAVMKRVADWQLANPAASGSRYTEDAWTWGALYTGMMAWSRMTDDPKHREAMMAMATIRVETCANASTMRTITRTQTYLELYLDQERRLAVRDADVPSNEGPL
ncbi:MAG: hypothetical protein U1F83_13155 [Verrucomicrobiota bacterium]